MALESGRKGVRKKDVDHYGRYIGDISNNQIEYKVIWTNNNPTEPIASGNIQLDVPLNEDIFTGYQYLLITYISKDTSFTITHSSGIAIQPMGSVGISPTQLSAFRFNYNTESFVAYTRLISILRYDTFACTDCHVYNVGGSANINNYCLVPMNIILIKLK